MFDGIKACVSIAGGLAFLNFPVACITGFLFGGVFTRGVVRSFGSTHCRNIPQEWCGTLEGYQTASILAFLMFCICSVLFKAIVGGDRDSRLWLLWVGAIFTLFVLSN